LLRVTRIGRCLELGWQQRWGGSGPADVEAHVAWRAQVSGPAIDTRGAFLSSAASRGSLSPAQLLETIATLSSPDRVESPFGGMDCFDGVPSPGTVTTIYDALDLMRGIEVFLNSVPGASLVAMRRGLRSAGMASRRSSGTPIRGRTQGWVDNPRQVVVSALPALRPAPTMVRPDLEAQRVRARRLSDRARPPSRWTTTRREPPPR
jgi:hypothetical protein